MYTIVYVGKVVTGTYEGKPYAYYPCVFADEHNRLSIDKIRDQKLADGLARTLGCAYEIYYDKYGRVTAVQKGVN